MLQKNEEAGLSPCPSADNINNKGNIFYSKFLSSATKVN